MHGWIYTEGPLAKQTNKQNNPKLAKSDTCTLTHRPLVAVCPAASSFCSFSKVWLVRRMGHRNANAASSKQAKLGTIVSQFRKLRFPLIIRTTCKTNTNTNKYSKYISQ